MFYTTCSKNKLGQNLKQNPLADSSRLPGPALLTVFDHLYIINLNTRLDRRREMEEQLALAGLESHPKVSFFSAVRGEAADGFASSGARGAFLSHLAILEAALAKGERRILIAEDDLDFAFPQAVDLATTLSPLVSKRWDFFYGGYHFPERFLSVGKGLIVVGSGFDIGGLHLYGVSAETMPGLIKWLYEVEARNARGQDTVPHIDLAYTAFRQQRADCVTYVMSPAIGQQRRSRSDIQETRFFDRIPFLIQIANVLRRALPRRKS
jgi:glycosyl transferase family 25